ncbi:hypothetical protein BDZ89DRAFT_1143527 [Hymenopellis radicata]|nr:hypothetical protein BDZ89DRAFT_1143527 [Hymenopellis radicata]
MSPDPLDGFQRTQTPSFLFASSSTTSLLAKSPFSTPSSTEASPHEIKDYVDQVIALREYYEPDRSKSPSQELDLLVELLQARQLKDPFARSFWCLIIQGRYVDFEKLFTSLSGTVNHHDDLQTFAGIYLLIKKDTYSARRTLQSESDWSRTELG